MLLLKLSSSVEEVRDFKSLSKKFDIYSKIVCRDAENFFRHQCELVLRHQMQVSNYFLKFFYSAPAKFRDRNFGLVSQWGGRRNLLVRMISTTLCAICITVYERSTRKGSPYNNTNI